MVTDPCLVVVNNTEAFTAKVTTVAIAIASVCISIVLWNVNMKATAEIAHIALRQFITGIYAVLALSTRAMAECQGSRWQWSTSNANVATTAVFTIDTRRKCRSEGKFIGYSRGR